MFTIDDIRTEEGKANYAPKAPEAHINPEEIIPFAIRQNAEHFWTI